MEELKEKIIELATDLIEQAVNGQDDYIEGVAQANTEFGHRVLAAYHDSEFKLALLRRAG